MQVRFPRVERLLPQCLSGGMERSTCLAGRLVSGISHHPDAISRQTLYHIHLVRALRRTSKGLSPAIEQQLHG